MQKVKNEGYGGTEKSCLWPMVIERSIELLLYNNVIGLRVCGSLYKLAFLILSRSKNSTIGTLYTTLNTPTRFLWPTALESLLYVAKYRKRLRINCAVKVLKRLIFYDPLPLIHDDDTQAY